MIKAKFKILIVLSLMGFSLSIMSNTYSRYVANTTGDIAMAFSKWQILVNNFDIENSNSTSVDITPTILENENVANNKLAPTSKGYFDIEINPTAVQVSFNYKIKILKDNNMPDLIIDKYAIIVDNNETDLIYNDILDNEISDSCIFEDKEDFSFKPFTIRVFFEWYDGNDNLMNDTDDTNLVNENESINIKANIQFQKKIN